ncbi:hypothetical protein GYMLUDRAFT_560638 [Collybiopsis luxurians FD-317 M1]|uniref:Uncharacterized protein n=1 Tax=Collybiopsis luxurians FD-317 M1 TaxID=944289 RepID=A0A0D0CZJ6_9AGAR|nr:hypothetical protein GYMLUDRAFT_560638 [Collybiopsis luxurians FD-317 M1]
MHVHFISHLFFSTASRFFCKLYLNLPPPPTFSLSIVRLIFSTLLGFLSSWSLSFNHLAFAPVVQISNRSSHFTF